MGTNSNIEWTGHTWNPIIGCRKVSLGCKNCYMFTEQLRYSQDPNTVRRTAHRTFTAPLRWKEPAFVFSCSWSDFFIETDFAWRREAWQIIKRTPHLTYQILTKRPENIERMLPPDWGNGYPNVWLGVTAENQHWLNVRGWELTTIPAVCRFLSIEPMLGPIQATFLLQDGLIDWVICGGESGSGCRPMQPDWVCGIKDECLMFGVPFFFKQWGGYPDKRGGDKATLDGKLWHEMPDREHGITDSQLSLF
jgi:protein gp37